MSSTPDKGSSTPDPTIDPTKEEPADSAPADEPEPADGGLRRVVHRPGRPGIRRGHDAMTLTRGSRNLKAGVRCGLACST